MDTTPIDLTLPGAPSSAIYSTCGNVKQGMSVGWADTYGSFLAGQAIDVSGLPDGRCNLIIEIDPQRRLAEVSESDNVSCVLLDLNVSTSSFTVVDAHRDAAPSPRLRASRSLRIVPNTMSAGSTNAVISGTDFSRTGERQLRQWVGPDTNSVERPGFG